MRARAWAAWASALLGAGLLVAGNLAGTTALRLPGGLLAAAAIVLGLGLLPLWRRAVPPLPPMPDLATRPRQGERWCAACGRPTRRDGPCASCGDLGRRGRRKQRRFQRKQGARPQERRT